MAKTILLIGAFDTKDVDYVYLRDRILRRDHRVLTVNTGVLGITELFPVDIEAAEVAEAGGANLPSLRAAQDRGEAMKAMSSGAPQVLSRLYGEGRFDGVIGMGGSGGSSVITAAMQALPVGVPKVCVSTVASGDTSPYVGIVDITLIPSIVDVAGVNSVSRIIYARAAGAICGMVEEEVETDAEARPAVAVHPISSYPDAWTWPTTADRRQSRSATAIPVACFMKMVELPEGKIQREIGPGTLVHIPTAVFHSTVNTGEEPMELVAIYAPFGPEAELRKLEGVTIEPQQKTTAA